MPSLLEFRILVCAMQRLHLDHFSIKSLNSESLKSLHGRLYLTRVIAAQSWELSVAPVSPLGRDSWKLVPGFLWTLPCLFFLFVDFVLCFFTVINHNCEYNCVLSSVSPLSKSSNMGVVLGTPDTVCLMFPYNHSQTVLCWQDTIEMIIFFTVDQIRGHRQYQLSHHW